MIKVITAALSAMNPALTAALIALVGVAISAMVSAAIARRSSYITAVTAQRSKWIDQLRENIAELLGVAGAIHLAHLRAPGVDAGNNREKSDRLIALLTMQLNPNGLIDSNLIILLTNIPNAAESTDDQYRKLEQALVRHSQFLLKEEWEKVKYEAMGCLSRPLWFLKMDARKHDYEEFCNGDESLVNTTAERGGRTLQEAGPMNWRGGLYRAWIVLSALWAAFCLWRSPISCVLKGLIPVGDEYCGIGRLADPGPYYAALAVKMVALPVVFLIIGFAIMWIVDGFRRATRNSN